MKTSLRCQAEACLASHKIQKEKRKECVLCEVYLLEARNVIGQLLLLIAVLLSIFPPRSGFTYDGAKQIELTVKTPRQIGPNGSALWVTNLGVDDTKLTVGGKYRWLSVLMEAEPTQFSGGGSDVHRGSGYNFGFAGWSTILGRFREIKANGSSKYYNGQGYIADGEVYVVGTSSPPAGGFSISWAVTPPPQSVHNSSDTYEWCVFSNDYFYSTFNCLYFYGPR